MNGTYFQTLTSAAQNMIADTKYYLGTLTFYNDPSDDDLSSYGINETPIEAYKIERAVTDCIDNKGPDENVGANLTFDSTPNCRVWANNAAYWEGKIALMYPSDYGFSTSEHWNTSMRGKYFNSMPEDTWLYKETNHNNMFLEYFLSPTTYDIYSVASWLDSGRVFSTTANILFSIRPTLYLKSEVQILGGNGTSSQPYKLKLS